ncbi:LbetaH domain-containing protein [Thermotalea metallivorans]|uniref:UDP-3-O-acylglucosamine N-acyltransferase n=1 Tax=Thermotalea metallivorans TaxID=520762 RepID=A0A140L4I3_9FIRM|nr:DapH/DapD/GlmU-related protein [Thermotalea metallivorans]KXG75458.1 UDP-3-O-acylglucosamine N-acyltransferase [Thermotalea metallivorans]
MLLREANEILSGLGYASRIVKDASFDLMGEIPEGYNGGTLRYLSDLKYFDKKISMAAALLIEGHIDLEKLCTVYDGGILVCENAKECFYALLIYLHENTDFFGMAYDTHIDDSAVIGKNVKIPSKNVRIGKGAIIEDDVIISTNVEIGEGTRICSGTILGSEGVMLCTIQGRRTLIPHAGKLVIGNRVAIMNHSIIQKGIHTGADTVIGDDVVIGSGVLIAHGTRIGSGTLILDHVNIAGYCWIGSNVWVGAGCVMRNGTKVGDNSHIALGTVLIENVQDNGKISGFFGIDRSKSLVFHERLKQYGLGGREGK